MNRFVLDCSVAMGWCFRDETSEYSADILRLLKASGAVVPSVWYLELVNALIVGERRGCLLPLETAEFIARVRKLPIDIDAIALNCKCDDILSLARVHSLSSYDEAYLELAIRTAMPIATLDGRLATAAASVGIKLLLKS